MPDPHDFLKGFNVTKGLNIGEWVLSDVAIDHNTISRYKEYEYPITLTFTSTGSKAIPVNNLLIAVNNYVAGNRIISSRYGNPYSCVFGVLTLASSDERTAILRSTGHSYRI